MAAAAAKIERIAEMAFMAFSPVLLNCGHFAALGSWRDKLAHRLRKKPSGKTCCAALKALLVDMPRESAEAGKSGLLNDRGLGFDRPCAATTITQ
ncbi:hypothetical protein [Methylocystis sp. B8]|uniref:hypothetical protein n=1 Tax=Methylocystis sp. B8 TaxID=544938 RepID=UPI0010FD18BC|nr:hypothetical protein [Methylocystis sp. B8]TLG73974.1 hypothetical protein FEV16_12010 [Methylocystis sp. B8]